MLMFFCSDCVCIISRSITLYLFQINTIEVVAVVNDAVGTLMSAAHSDRQCEIGLILGQYSYTLVYKIIIFNVHRNCSILSGKFIFFIYVSFPIALFWDGIAQWYPEIENPCRFLFAGTGCNACYMESLENVGLWEEDRDHPNQVQWYTSTCHSTPQNHERYPTSF